MNTLLSSLVRTLISLSFSIASNLIYTMGSNSYGQLGINDKRASTKNSPVLVENLMDKKPLHISCGAYHTAMCTQDGEVFTWG
jgi:alpha-tubulin suppressor-like RCC1 family protein